MAFNIQEFISHIEGENETSKSDKFDVIITIPDPLTSILGDGQFLQLSCESAEFPAGSITPLEFVQYGFVQRIPYHLDFAPVSFTFLCTGNMAEKTFFDAWLNQMIPFTTGLLEYRDDISITTPIIINQYDNMGNVNYSVQLIDAFPLNVSSLPVSWTNDQTHRVTVTFSYSRWISNSTQTGQDSASQPSNLNNPIQNLSPPSITPSDFPFPSASSILK